MCLWIWCYANEIPKFAHQSSSTHIPDKLKILYFSTQRKTNFLKHFNGRHTLISYKMYKTEKHSDECCIVCLNILHSGTIFTIIQHSCTFQVWHSIQQKTHFSYQQHKQHSSQALVIVQAVVDMNKLHIISSTPLA